MKAIIIDDEIASAETLLILLTRHCPDIHILSIESDITLAVQKITTLQPDIVFLDIILHNATAFDIIAALEHVPGIIFTSAHDKFAWKAFRFDSIDYLLKPIEPAELKEAVEKARQKITVNNHTLAPVNIYLKRIGVPTNEGIIFIDLVDVIRMEADGSYTKIMFQDGTNCLVSKNMGKLEKMLLHTTFFRSHKSHFINKQHIKKILFDEGGLVLMSNGDKVPIARRNRDQLITLMAVDTTLL